MTKIFVLHHAQCTDGTGAKFAAWKKFGSSATYLPVQYGQPIPNLGDDLDTEVYILDFSYPKETLKEFQAKFKKVVVLDHHKTAKEDLEGLEGDIFFDMNKSGAMLAWEYFHPNTRPPELIFHIQDRDLWRFHLHGTAEVHAGLGLLKGNMGLWKNYADDSDAPENKKLKELKETGSTILNYERQQIDAAVPKKVKVIDFCGYKTGIINSGYLVSETGTAIYESKDLNVDVAIMYFIGTDDVVYLSFRSKKGGPDVSKLAKLFGGGGHENASGGRTDLKTLSVILKGQFHVE